MSAQQEFLKAVLSQSSGLDFPKVAFTAQGVTETNMGLISQASILMKIGGVADGTFQTHTIPGSTGMQDGLSYFFRDEAATRELMRSIYSANTQ
jgi:anionic cell wall polymer biosynthesis LytR-Cps2A-Psr (LCP) family protein